MKRTLLAIALVGVATTAAYAQGTVQFLNSVLSPVYYQETPCAQIVPAPSGTFIGLYWGTSPGVLTLAGTTRIGATAGIFNAGTVYAIPGSYEGQRVFLQIRGWLGGDTFDTATTVGQSTVVQATLGPTAGPGTVVWQATTGTSPERMKPFVIYLPSICVPEPSVSVIGALGLSLLLLRSRKADSCSEKL